MKLLFIIQLKNKESKTIKERLGETNDQIEVLTALIENPHRITRRE